MGADPRPALCHAAIGKGRVNLLRTLFDNLRARVIRGCARWFLPPEKRSFLKPSDPYQDWIIHNRLNPRRRADLHIALEKQAGQLPLISVVMPIYRPDKGLLMAALASVRAQVFDNWELCLCDDGSGDSSLTQLLTDLASQDRRIHVSSLPRNGGISEATNEAASLARGDVLLFLDQDDLLSAECLAEFALAFAADPHLDLAYSDSDKIDIAGRRGSPSFKPGWSPTLLASHMYLGHAVAIRAQLFIEMGGMRRAFDGSQDYDLALRATERARRITHIPKVLYHWRVVPGSTAISAGEKPGSIDAGQRCLAEAIVRRKIPAAVSWPSWAKAANIGLFELNFLPSGQSVALVVFEEDGARIADDWLRQISRAASPEIQVLLVPDDGTPLGQRLLRKSDALSGRHVVLLRAGTHMHQANWLSQLVGYARLGKGGLAAARSVDSLGAVASAGLVLPGTAENCEPAFAGVDQGRAGSIYCARVAHECLAVDAVCVALDRSLVDLIAAVSPNAEDCFALGFELSEAVRRKGGNVVCVASCTAAIAPSHRHHYSLRGKHPDIWYNRNLGATGTQFRPARRAPSPHVSRPVRLAVSTHNLDREGAQLMLHELLVGLKRGGFVEPHLFSPRDGELRDVFEAEGIPVEIVSWPARRTGGRKLDVFASKLAKTFQAGGFEAVLVNTLDGHVAVEAAWQAGMGSIWWQHEGGSWHRYYRRLPWSARARALAAFSQAYRVVQVAEATRQNWLPIACRDNFQLIRNGIPAETVNAMVTRWTRSQARDALRLNDNECCVVLVGSVSSRKGQGDVISALADMSSDQAARFRFIVVGALVDKKYCDGLLNKFKNLSSDKQSRVTIVGAVDDPSLYYAAADIFLCCSRQESAPRAIIEAMEFGLPIVSTPVDGIPELVRFQRDGLSYEPGNHRALIDILDQLVASPEQRLQLGRSSKHQASLVNDYERMIAQFGQLLREAALVGASDPVRIE